MKKKTHPIVLKHKLYLRFWIFYLEKIVNVVQSMYLKRRKIRTIRKEIDIKLLIFIK